jgi:hypothetical protein
VIQPRVAVDIHTSNASGTTTHFRTKTCHSVHSPLTEKVGAVQLLDSVSRITIVIELLEGMSTQAVTWKRFIASYKLSQDVATRWEG